MRNVPFIKEWYGLSDEILEPITARVLEMASKIEDKRLRDWEVVRGLAEVARAHNTPQRVQDREVGRVAAE